MFSKILQTGSRYLLILLAVLLLLNGILLLCAGYQRHEFVVMRVYTDHTTKFGDSHSLILQAIDKDKIIRPEPFTVKGEYHVGDKILLWYHPTSNTVAQYFMLCVIVSFVCSVIIGAYVIRIWPRKSVSRDKSRISVKKK